MAAFDNIHSRLVFWLKILLPLAALAILSTLFLISRRIDTDGALPYAHVDVKELARDQRLTQPEYTGVTSDGTAFSLRAGVARPLADAGGEAQDVTATFETKDGLVLGLGADSAQVDTGTGLVSLAGNVILSTSTGYRMNAQVLTAALKATEVKSDGAVTASAPFGELDAGGMLLSQDPASADGYVLVFNRGVKLLYLPQN
jgi:lipopolysaccharide export system protein LptC